MSDGNSIQIPIEGNTGPLLKTLAGLGAAVAGAFAFKKMIDAAMEADRALNSLNNAMKVSGTYTKQASEDFQEYAKSLQQTTGVSDDLITQNAALLVSIGQLSGQGLKDATKAALDLAAGTGKDVSTAFEIMSKAAQGNTAALGKMGIKISEAVPENERFAASLALINSRFGGLAAGQMNTFEGALTGLKNNFGDLLEEIGKMFTHSPVLIMFIKEIAMWFGKLSGSVENFGKSGDHIGDVIKGLISVGLTIINYVMPPFELLYNLGEFIFNGIVTMVNKVITVIASLGNGIGQLGSAIGIISDETAAGLATFAQSAQTTLDQSMANTKDSFQDMFNFDATVAADNFANSMAQMAAAAKPPLDALKGHVVSAQTAISENAKKIGDAFKSGLVSTISGGIQKMATNLAQGKNIFDDFGKTIMGLIGDLAIQVGTVILTTGIAYQSLGEFTGTSAIIWGGALIALGAILKAFSGSGGGVSAGAGGGSGGASGSSAGSDSVDVSEEDVTVLEPQKPQTSLVVNIQGNVLDRRQTGIEIAEVIQETFGTNGVNFST